MFGLEWTSYRGSRRASGMISYALLVGLIGAIALAALDFAGTRLQTGYSGLEAALSERETADGGVVGDGGLPVAVTVSDAVAAEGSALIFEVSLDRPAPSGGVRLDWAFVAGSASAADVIAPHSGSMTLAEGDRRGAFQLMAAEDGEAEGIEDETFTLALSSPTAGVELTSSTARGRIVDMDFVIVRLVGDRNADGWFEVREGGPDLSVAIVPDTPIDRSVFFSFSLVGAPDYVHPDGATGDPLIDPAWTGGFISLPAHSSGVSFTLRAADDDEVEPTRYLRLDLHNTDPIARFVDHEVVAIVSND